MDPWGTSALTWYSFKLPIRIDSKLSVTKKRNKAKYLTWNSIRLRINELAATESEN